MIDRLGDGGFQASPCVTVIEDTGHLLPLETPGPVANLLSEFAAATGQ